MLEDKIARICWNTNYWQKPSGMKGKVTSKSSKAYETTTGYGHEEWLLDTNKIISGYHYAYIQAIGQHRDKYLDKTFNISLYSINSTTKERWWLGEIQNVEVVEKSESISVYEEYKTRGWLKEMISQLEDVNANIEDFNSISPENFSCIKFKASNLKILDEPRQFSSSDPAVKSDYYNLKNKVGIPILGNQDFIFECGHNEGKKTTTSSYNAGNKDIDLLHNQIQTIMYNELVKKHGVKNVASEQKTGIGTKIDIAVKVGESFTFYEVKTANTVKACIREALAQLMEYAYYPNEERASKLYIVSPNAITKDSDLYLKNIRNKFNIPVYYQQIDIDKKCLIDES